MAEFDNTNRGVLFREKEKKNERSPDYTGRMHVLDDESGELKEYRVAGWIKESSKGNKFLSLALTPKDE